MFDISQKEHIFLVSTRFVYIALIYRTRVCIGTTCLGEKPSFLESIIENHVLMTERRIKRNEIWISGSCPMQSNTIFAL